MHLPPPLPPRPRHVGRRLRARPRLLGRRRAELAAGLYIAFIAVLGLAGARSPTASHRQPTPPRLLARLGAAALLLGVVFGTARWIADGSLGGDGAEGVVITAYFLLGGVLYARLADVGRAGIGRGGRRLVPSMPAARDLRLLVGAVGLSSLGDRVALVPLALLVEQRGGRAWRSPRCSSPCGARPPCSRGRPGSWRTRGRRGGC